MSQAAEIEAMLFKPFGDRYVFQATSPWLFGRCERYLVTETQKRELLAIVVPRRPILRIAIVTAAVLLWTAMVALAIWAISGNDQPGTRDIVAIVVLTVVPMCGALIAMLRRNRRRMQPILANAPRTDERITSRELRKAMAAAVTVRRAVLYASLWTMVCGFQVFTLIIRNPRHPLFGDFQSYVNVFTATLAAGLAVYYLVLMVRKLRQKETVSA